MSVVVDFRSPLNSSGAQYARVVELPVSTCTANYSKIASLKKQAQTCEIELMAYFGAAIAHEKHVAAFDVAVDDADRGVVQILQGRRHFTHSLKALVRGGRVGTSQSLRPVSTRRPLRNDEEVRGIRAGCEDLHAVGVADLKHKEKRKQSQ